MDLEELRAFLAVAETGSFLAAATTTGLSRTTVRRRVDALEARSGVRLVERTRRGVVVTAPGELIAARGRQMLQETRALLDSVRDVGTEPAGDLQVVTPGGMPAFFLGPWIQWIRRKFPRVRVAIELVDDPVARLLDGADVALHFGPAPIGPWSSEVLFSGTERLVASARYLERRGAPKTIADLRQHDLVCATAAGEDPTRWPDLAGGEFAIEPVVVASDITIVRHCVLDHAGISLLPERMFAPEVARGRMVIVLPDLVGRTQYLRITVPEVLKTIPKIQRVVSGSLSYYRKMAPAPA